MVKNKLAVINVLADLVHDPMLLLDENYPLSPKDFPERFHRIVFGAVDTLAHQGIQDLDEIVIDNYLSNYAVQYKIFEENDGVEYIRKARAISNPSNFPYYYQALKKCSLLNALEENGFDISPFYNPSLLHANEQEAVQEALDKHSVEDILAHYELQLNQMQREFNTNSLSVGCQAGEGLEALVEKYKQEPDFGFGMNSRKMTTICRGRRPGTLYLRTAPTSLGKTRVSLADACYVAIPEYYNLAGNTWEQSGNQEPTLYITTELNHKELQTMILAYVSGVPENHILDGRYEPGEEERIQHAIPLIRQAPLYLENISMFNAADIEALIKKYKLEKQITCVFFDYLQTSIKMLEEISRKSNGVRLREDNVLIMFAERMKTLAERLNIHIDTSTQANGEWKASSSPDQSLIRGSKGIADKADIGYCMLPLSDKDREGIQDILSAHPFLPEPNIVFHVYKVRRGSGKDSKVFLRFDYATLHTIDLFVTDGEYKLQDVPSTNVKVRVPATKGFASMGFASLPAPPAFASPSHLERKVLDL